MPSEPCSMCFHWPMKIVEANQVAFYNINAEVIEGRIFISISMKFSSVHLFSSLFLL